MGAMIHITVVGEDEEGGVDEEEDELKIKMPKDVLSQQSPIFAKMLGAGDWGKSKVPRGIEVKCKKTEAGVVFFHFMMKASYLESAKTLSEEHVKSVQEQFPSCTYLKYLEEFTKHSLDTKTSYSPEINWSLPVLLEVSRLSEYYQAPNVQHHVIESLKAFLERDGNGKTLEYVSAMEGLFDSQEFEWGEKIYRKLASGFHNGKRSGYARDKDTSVLASSFRHLSSDRCLSAKLTKTTLLRTLCAGTGKVTQVSNATKEKKKLGAEAPSLEHDVLLP